MVDALQAAVGHLASVGHRSADAADVSSAESLDLGQASAASEGVERHRRLALRLHRHQTQPADTIAAQLVGRLPRRARSARRRGPSSRLPRNVVHAPPSRTKRSISAGVSSSRSAARRARAWPRRSARRPAAPASPSPARSSSTSSSVPTSTSSARSSAAVVGRADRHRLRTRTPARCRGPPRAASGTRRSRRRRPAAPARPGAAPRQRGSSEKCRLTIGSASSTCGLISWPKATTTPRSAPTPSTSSTRCDTGRPSSIAAAFTGLGISCVRGRAACRRG